MEEAAAYLEETGVGLGEYLELVRGRARELFGLDQPPPDEHGDQQAERRRRRDIHRGSSTGGDGKVDTTWALVWHLDAAGKVDRVVNLSGDQHQMDAFIWANFPRKPRPERLVG